MARPTKLTPERRKRILASVRAGNYLHVAARAGGINPATLFEWQARGRAEPGSVFAEFSDALKEAEAQGEEQLLRQISRASKKTWQAAAWMLERKNPARWGQRVRVHVEEELNAAIARLREQLGPDEFKRALRAIASEPGREGAGGDPGDGSGGSEEPDAGS